jgi:hypothetical protein
MCVCGVVTVPFWASKSWGIPSICLTLCRHTHVQVGVSPYDIGSLLQRILGDMGEGGALRSGSPSLLGALQQLWASLQIISHDTRRFRFALPSPQHILGLPIGESWPAQVHVELGG